MLGKLARWLRLLGYDSSYYRDIEDRRLLELAKINDRVLITRDKEVVQKAKKTGIKIQEIKGTVLKDQLAEVTLKWNLNKTLIPEKTRCVSCNGEVKIVKKICVQGRVPNGTFSYHNQFWECTQCEKIYWKGAHWKNISHVESELNQQ